MMITCSCNYSKIHYLGQHRNEAEWVAVTHLTLQEEENSSFHEIGIQTLSTSSLRHAVILYVLMAEQPVKENKDVSGRDIKRHLDPDPVFHLHIENRSTLWTLYHINFT